jgi:hypothetical protein
MNKKKILFELISVKTNKGTSLLTFQNDLFPDHRLLLLLYSVANGKQGTRGILILV